MSQPNAERPPSLDSAPDPQRRVYQFGPFLLDATERLLRRDGHPVALTPKAFDLLVYLLERPGHLAEKVRLVAREGRPHKLSPGFGSVKWHGWP